MTADVLLLLMLLVAPGALFLHGWDIPAHRHDRTQLSLFGIGALVSVLIYSTLQAVGCIDIRHVLAGDALDFSALVYAPNLRFVAGLGLGCWAGGLCASRLVHVDLVQRCVIATMGQDTFGSTWAEIVSSAVNKWVYVTLTNGDQWRGRVASMPTRADEALFALSSLARWDEGAAEWKEFEAERIVLRTADLASLVVAPLNVPKMVIHANKASPPAQP